VPDHDQHAGGGRIDHAEAGERHDERDDGEARRVLLDPAGDADRGAEDGEEEFQGFHGRIVLVVV
jgi:hypothetical protein